MSTRKYQEDLRRIVGLKDDGKQLEDQVEREDILSSRGVAYFNAGGGISSGSEVPDDAEEAADDKAENGDGTGSSTDGSSPDGTGTGAPRSNKFCADGSLRPFLTGICPEDLESAAKLWDDIGDAIIGSQYVPAITGLQDCDDPSQEVTITFDDSGAGESLPKTVENLILDENGNPVLDDNGVAQYEGQQESGCIPPDGWDTCECYQTEKRGGLKGAELDDGDPNKWDSLDYWRNPTIENPTGTKCANGETDPTAEDCNPQVEVEPEQCALVNPECDQEEHTVGEAFCEGFGSSRFPEGTIDFTYRGAWLKTRQKYADAGELWYPTVAEGVATGALRFLVGTSSTNCTTGFRRHSFSGNFVNEVCIYQYGCATRDPTCTNFPEYCCGTPTADQLVNCIDESLDKFVTVVSDGAQDYTASQAGISPNPYDGDIPPEQAEDTNSKFFCDANGNKVRVVNGINGNNPDGGTGTLFIKYDDPNGNTISGGTDAVHYFRDSATGKMSYFGATELSKYLPQEVTP
jgi:hypothetical protein